MFKKIIGMHWILRILITFVWLSIITGCDYFFPVFFESNTAILMIPWVIIAFTLISWTCMGLIKIFPGCDHH